MKNKIFAFFIPFTLLIFLFIIKNLFIKNSFLYSDSACQYYQLFIYLKDFLDNGSLYSFEVSLGSSMFSTILYYLFSLSNILIKFINKNKIELFLTFTSIIKISLCGLTMYKYLNYQNKSRYTLAFSTAYALSFHIILNYFQFMWLDAYILAPLLLLGIDKIINEKNFYLYGVILFLIILSNYYMGYMCCIFSVIYFIYKFLLSKREKKVIIMFITISILFGLMTMFVHFPNLLEIKDLNRVKVKNIKMFNLDLSGMLSKMLLGSNVYGGVLNLDHPLLYIGLFNIPLLVFYFFNKNIDLKERKLSFAFLLVLIFSVVFNPLNKFWHVLTSPIGFNFRYLYLFNIFIISLCYKSFINLKYISKMTYIYFLYFFLIGIGIVMSIDIMKMGYILINIILIGLYLLIFKMNSSRLNKLFIILAIAELFFNSYTIFDKINFFPKSDMNNRLNEKTDIINNINDDSFYRMELLDKFYLNDPLNYNYKGASGWFSSAKINYKFFRKIGYLGLINRDAYNSYIPTDSLFNIKYLYSPYLVNHYELVNNDLENLYKNPYALSLGFMSSDKIKNKIECNNVFECQNLIFNNLTDTPKDIYEYYNVKNNDILKNESNLKELYVFPKRKFFADGVKYDLCINDDCYKFKVNENLNLLLNNPYKDMNFVSSNIDEFDVGFYNHDEFINKYNLLKDNQLNITSFKDSHIKGNINVKDNKVLFLSIPYDDCFKILVDNKEVEYYKLIDNFIGLDLSTGYHNIEIMYKINGLKIGFIISLISLIIFILIRKHL